MDMGYEIYDKLMTDIISGRYTLDVVILLSSSGIRPIGGCERTKHRGKTSHKSRPKNRPNLINKFPTIRPKDVQKWSKVIPKSCPREDIRLEAMMLFEPRPAQRPS